ncbi:MAG: hydroxymethylglutaryl-CoA reductase, degradative [Bacteroidota bacterium]|nr:hydroxymethylglutaryl-CoA reductase, degradative [Bacteroidota bacterium]
MKNKENKQVSGFSKLEKSEKIDWVITNYFDASEDHLNLLKKYWNDDQKLQNVHDEFIENAITNFYTPYGIAPNFKINDVNYCVPMAIEESSVVAAAAKSARFWFDRGGFRAEVLSQKKIGHVHLIWPGENPKDLGLFFDRIKSKFFEGTEQQTKNMRKRGGGILDIQLHDKTKEIDNYFQLEVTFDTCDAMGANFINTVLEKMAKIFESELRENTTIHNEIEIVMCILSNYTPECLVRCEVRAPIEKMVSGTEILPQDFAKKFLRAIEIAETQIYRAVTHNKGIMNGIDSVIVATGNDYRAIEACAHAYACRNGQYSSLSHAELTDGELSFWLEMPMSLGTVGGITKLHPMVRFSHELLGNPSAEDLMKICASVGLAQNFSALRSLTTTGIQKGHMKMHLLNVLNQLGANKEEKRKMIEHFKHDVAHYNKIVQALNDLRKPS